MHSTKKKLRKSILCSVNISLEFENRPILRGCCWRPLYLVVIRSAPRHWKRIQQGKANTLLNISNNYSREQILPLASNFIHIFTSNDMHQQYLQKFNETEDTRYGPISNKLFRKVVEKFHKTTHNVVQTRSKMKTLTLLISTWKRTIS